METIQEKKVTDAFKMVIDHKLQSLACEDPLFAETLKKENKNIDDCISYILNTVQKSGCNGFTDDEIFGMAIHYYDEDNLESDTRVNCHIVVNHAIELTPEEIEQLKSDAKAKVFSDETDRILGRNQPKKPEPKIVQTSMF